MHTNNVKTLNEIKDNTERTGDYEELRVRGSGVTEHVYAVPLYATSRDDEDTENYIDIIPDDYVNSVSGNSNPAFHSVS